MAEQYEKPYLDSNVFIAWIKGEVVDGVDRGAIADHILSLAERGVFKIYTSTLTLAEVHKLRTGPALSGDSDERILAFFENDFIQLIDVDRKVGEDANRYCREFGIYPNDAVHLACALKAGCDAVLAWDDRFARVERSDIRIEEPRIIGQSELPGMPSRG